MDSIIRRLEQLHGDLAAWGDNTGVSLHAFTYVKAEETTTKYTISADDWKTKTEVTGVDFNEVADEFLRRRRIDKALNQPKLPAPQVVDEPIPF